MGINDKGNELLNNYEEMAKKYSRDCYLDISGANEHYYRLCNNSGKTGSLLSLTSVLLTSFYELSYTLSTDLQYPSPDQVNKCLIDFYQTTVGVEFIMDNPAPLYTVSEGNIEYFPEGSIEKELSDAFMLWGEVLNLRNAVNFWLSPIMTKKFPDAMESLLAPEYHSIYKNDIGIFKWRCSELKITPTLQDGVWGKSFEARGLLPLCWAEIWYALEKGIMARSCPYCWSAYIIKPRGLHKANCGDPKCVTAYKKEKNGPGWEAERKADRPLDPMKRKNVGRPKEIKTLEALSLLKEGYNEDEIAKIMSRKYGMKIFSSQISRWLKRDVLHPRNPKKRNRS